MRGEPLEFAVGLLRSRARSRGRGAGPSRRARLPRTRTRRPPCPRRPRSTAAPATGRRDPVAGPTSPGRRPTEELLEVVDAVGAHGVDRDQGPNRNGHRPNLTCRPRFVNARAGSPAAGHRPASAGPRGRATPPARRTPAAPGTRRRGLDQDDGRPRPVGSRGVRPRAVDQRHGQPAPPPAVEQGQPTRHQEVAGGVPTRRRTRRGAGEQPRHDQGRRAVGGQVAHVLAVLRPVHGGPVGRDHRGREPGRAGACPDGCLRARALLDGDDRLEHDHYRLARSPFPDCAQTSRVRGVFLFVGNGSTPTQEHLVPATPPPTRLPRLRHHPARRRPARGHQLLGRRQARRGAADGRARRRLHRGRLAGRAAQGHRVLRPRPHRAQAPARPAGRVRRDPQGRRPRRGRPAGAGAAGRRDAGRVPGRQVRRAARARGAAHDARGEPRHGAPTPSPSSSPRAAGCSSTASTSSTATPHDRDYGVRVLEAAFGAGAEVGVMCDTNGGMLPMGVGRVVADVRARTERQARHPLPGRHRLRRRQLAGRRRGRRHPRAGHGERLRRARGQRRPVLAGRQPGDQDGPAGRAAGVPARAASGSATRIAELANIAPDDPPAVRRDVGLRAQGRPARQRDQGRARSSTTTSTRRSSATTCGSWSPRWPAGPRSSSRAASSASTSPGQADAIGRVVDRVKVLEADGWSFEAADASFELLLRAELPDAPRRCSSWSATRRSVEHWGNGVVVSEATVKVHVEDGERIIATAEGNGPVNALDNALRQALVPLPGPGRRRAGRLQGPHPRLEGRHRAPRPGC